MVNLLQYIAEFRTKQEAEDSLDWLATQVDYKGGRVLAPTNQEGKDSWRLQAFFEDGTGPEELLPDGFRRVLVPENLKPTLGINA